MALWSGCCALALLSLSRDWSCVCGSAPGLCVCLTALWRRGAVVYVCVCVCVCRCECMWGSVLRRWCCVHVQCMHVGSTRCLVNVCRQHCMYVWVHTCRRLCVHVCVCASRQGCVCSVCTCADLTVSAHIGTEDVQTCAVHVCRQHCVQVHAHQGACVCTGSSRCMLLAHGLICAPACWSC